MATTVDSLVVTLGLVGGYTKSSDLTTIREAINITNNPTAYANGTGSNQINAVFTDTVTLAATNTTYDLDVGLMQDGLGNFLTWTKIKLLYIRNKSVTSGQTLTITGDFLSQATVGAVAAGGLIIGAGGMFALENSIAGYSVVASSGDQITLTNSVSFDFDIVVLGTV